MPKLNSRIALMTAVAVLCGTANSSALAFTLAGSVWEKESSRQCGVDPRLLYAIALVEAKAITGHYAAPNPLALNISDRGYHPVSRKEAEDLLSNATQKTSHIAVGAMQISLRWNGNRVARPEMLLDLHTNVRVGTEILCEMLAGATTQDSIEEAIGRYHTPNQKLKDVARTYGQNVLRVWRRLILLTEK